MLTLAAGHLIRKPDVTRQPVYHPTADDRDSSMTRVGGAVRPRRRTDVGGARRKRALLAGALALLLGPSSNVHGFDGLPLSSPAEFAALLILLPALLSRPVVSRLPTLRGRWFTGTALLIAAGLAAKLILAAVGPMDGFRASYSSPLAEPLGPVEVSYENPLRRQGATRFDPIIDFDADRWNLVFLNSLRFNYSGSDAPHDRTRLPVRARWVGPVHADRDWPLQVEYVGAVRVTVGGRTYDLPPQYASAGRVTIPVDVGTHILVLTYEFDDTSPEARQGPYARVRVCLMTESGSCEAVTAASVAWPWRLMGATIDLIVVALLMPVIAVLARLVFRERRFLISTGVATAASLGLLYGLAGLSLALVAIVFVQALSLWWPGRRRRLVVSYLVLAIVMPVVAVLWIGSPGHVWLRPGGSDWLTYEDQARSILESGSLQGGEDVFYYQPFFRYIRFLEHLLLGDGDAFIVGAAMLALSSSALWTIAAFVPGRRSWPRFVVWALSAGLVLAWILALPVLGLVRAGASEYPTWVCLMLAWRLLLARSAHPAAWAAGAVVVAVAFITRTNQGFGLGGLLIAALALQRELPRSHRRAGLAAAAMIAALPLAHNLYFGGRPILLTASAGISANLVLPPDVLASAASDETARAALFEQLSWLVVLDGAPPLPALARGAQLIWVGALVWLAVRGRRLVGLWVMAMVPALFLSVHLLYQVTVYFPRHVVAGHLAMALVGLALVRTSSGVEPELIDQPARWST